MLDAKNLQHLLRLTLEENERLRAQRISDAAATAVLGAASTLIAASEVMGQRNASVARECRRYADELRKVLG